MNLHKSPPFPAYFLLLLLLFQGLSGLYGGFSLILDPSGKFLQMPLSWLENTPFTNYLIPGLILFSILGILPMLVTWSLWFRLNWAWGGAVIVGIALIIWIGVEILMIGYHSKPPLQLIYGLTGILILLLTLLPPVRRFYI